jgi:hypothetical protein
MKEPMFISCHKEAGPVALLLEQIELPETRFAIDILRKLAAQHQPRIAHSA